MKERRISKRLLTGFIAVLLLLCVFSAPVLAALVDDGNDLTVAVPRDRCPVFYEDGETGEPTGIGVDMMRAVARAAGYRVSFRFIKEETLKLALDNPDYDIIMPFGSAIPSASGQPTVVTENLMQTPFVPVTSGSRKLPQLDDLRVGMLSSLAGGAETVRQLYPGMEIVLYDTMDESVRALRRGEVDALLHNSFVWSYVLQKPLYSDLKVQPTTFFSMDFRAGTLDTPAGRERIERLNGGIASLTDTQQQAIILDHTSRRLYRYDFFDYLYEYGVILLLTALLFAALTFITVQKRCALRREQEEKLRQLIDNDPLTSALSLNGFRKRVEELLHAHPEIPYFLSYNNIRNFKFINESLGMAAGDELLRFWISKSQEYLSDTEAIARIEGDHVVILRHLAGEEAMQRDDENIFVPVRRYFTDRGKDNRIQLCSGIYVLTPQDYQRVDVDHMLDCARVAEKRLRDTRNEGYEFYNPNQWEKERRVADISGYLPIAIQNQEIQVWYQPQVNYSTGEIIGAEALCRWNHAKLGWLRPAEFIPTLEETGLIYDLDCYVWEKVCQDLQRWNEKGKHLSVSVNLARCDIREDRNIPGHFYELLQTYHLSTDQLRIEITESAYVENPELLIRTTVKLREFGFQVEMDDFGSGYSSLHMLKEMPVDRIKLDLHFLTGTGDPERGRIIVTYIIQMIRSLGMSYIAEGVENVTQANFLKSRDCLEMQGFYFYKPMSVSEFEEIMDTHKTPEQ